MTIYLYAGHHQTVKQAKLNAGATMMHPFDDIWSKMLMNQTDYLATIQEIKAEIQKAQYQATVKVNHELLLTYYHIGQGINRHKVWGDTFIEHLFRDLWLEYPYAKGYSVRNL